MTTDNLFVFFFKLFRCHFMHRKFWVMTNREFSTHYIHVEYKCSKCGYEQSETRQIY